MIGSDHKTTEEILLIPLERTTHDFVEVIDVKHQSPLGGGLGAKGLKMGIAAELELQARVGQLVKVCRHQHQRYTEKTKTRDPCLLLGLQLGNGVGSIGRR